MPRPLSKLTKFGFGVGHLFNDLCIALWFTYFLLYYTLVAEFSPASSGIVALIGQVADGIANPTIGFWSDRHSLFCFKSQGKRKSWYMFGTLTVLFSTPFMYSPCLQAFRENEVLAAAYYSFFVVLFQLGSAAIQSSHLALLTELTVIGHERIHLISLRNTFTVVSNLIVYSVAYVIFTYFSREKLSSKDALSFQIIVGVLILIGGTTSVIFFLTVKEMKELQIYKMTHIGSIVTQSSIRGSGLFAHFIAACALLKKWSIFHVAMIYTSAKLYSNIVMAFTPLYLENSLQLSTASIAIVPLTVHIVGLIMSLLSRNIIYIIGKKPTFFVGIVFGIASCLWLVLDKSFLYRKIFVYFVASFFGICTSVMLIVSLAIIGDLIGSGRNNTGFILGIMSFVENLSSGMVIMMIQVFADESNENYYTYSLGIINCVSAAFAGLMVLFLPDTLVSERNLYEGEGSIVAITSLKQLSRGSTPALSEVQKGSVVGISVKQFPRASTPATLETLPQQSKGSMFAITSVKQISRGTTPAVLVLETPHQRTSHRATHPENVVEDK